MPTTPGGRWSPNNGDGYDLITHLAAMQVSNESATGTEIGTAIAAIPPVPQNYRIGTNDQRLAIPVGQLFEGLRFYATDTANPEWIYTGSVWAQPLIDHSGVNGAIPANVTMLTRRGFGTVTRASNGVALYTFPIAFPTQIAGFSALTVSGSGTPPVVNSSNISRTAVELIWVGAGAGTSTFSWTAWGY